MFLSADTGGGHRASAESLGKQFELLFPGSTYDLLDVYQEDGCAPYTTMKGKYKHLSANAAQWKIVYEFTNNKPFEVAENLRIRLVCEKRFRERIKSYSPDVVVSVHPLMNNVPASACKKISQETGNHLPMFTVITDLASCHINWFSGREIENLFVPSDAIRTLAKKKGGVPEEKIVQIGLPIRYDFAVQAEKLGDRMSDSGILYQLSLREKLKISGEKRTILVMGGGEGVGSLSSIVDALFVDLSKRGLDATLLVVCGRNEKLKHDIEDREWDITSSQLRLSTKLPSCWSPPMVSPSSSGCLDESIANRIKRIVSKNTLNDALSSPLPIEISSDEDEDECPVEVDTNLGQVDVVGLGFITNIAEYMAASDVLVTKAGPGTIAEAAAVGLPVMLTSFLPGQEEGNADFVIEKEFGTLIPDYDPVAIAEEVGNWLEDSELLTRMSSAATRAGAPYAAREIARAIGESALRWRDAQEIEVVSSS